MGVSHQNLSLASWVSTPQIKNFDLAHLIHVDSVRSIVTLTWRTSPCVSANHVIDNVLLDLGVIPCSSSWGRAAAALAAWIPSDSKYWGIERGEGPPVLDSEKLRAPRRKKLIKNRLSGHRSSMAEFVMRLPFACSFFRRGGGIDYCGG